MSIFDFFRRKKDKDKASKLKVRVEPFDDDVLYYAIYYRLDGKSWCRLNRNYLDDKEYFCRDDQPCLYESFDEAVKVADDLTVEKINEYNYKKSKEFMDHIRKLRDKIKKRNKSYEKDISTESGSVVPFGDIKTFGDIWKV